MPLLEVVGGPVAPSGQVLTTGTTLMFLYYEPYVDGTAVYPQRIMAEFDTANFRWKPAGTPNGTIFYIPGHAQVQNPRTAPRATIMERHSYVSGLSQEFYYESGPIIETSAGEWRFGVDLEPIPYPPLSSQGSWLETALWSGSGFSGEEGGIAPSTQVMFGPDKVMWGSDSVVYGGAPPITAPLLFGLRSLTYNTRPVYFRLGEDGPSPDPVAHFTYDPEAPVTGQQVTFDASTSTGIGLSYLWQDMGPGGPWYLGEGETLPFTFQGEGTKFVRLTITDSIGRTSTHQINIYVSNLLPPAGTLLSFPPPANWQNYTIMNVSATGGGITLNDNTDYRLIMPSTPRTTPLSITGGRNIVVIGGEINISQEPPWGFGGAVCTQEFNARGLGIFKSSNSAYHSINRGRIIHIEGLLIRGFYMSDVHISAEEADIRFQNVRVECGMWYRDSNLDPCPSPHPDVIQPWGGYGWLRLDRFTGLVTGQGFFIRQDLGPPNQGFAQMRRTNLREQFNTNTEYLSPFATHPRPSGRGPRYYWWTNSGTGQIRLHQGTVWFDHPTRSILSSGSGSMIWPHGFPTGTDGTGNWASPEQTTGWDGTGSGRIYGGLPPGGDYVPVGLAGLNYVSPGYES